MRPKGAKGRSEWQDVGGGRIDPSVPYEVKLPSGRRIALFFYDGAVSRAVAFEGLLISGERFADRLMSTVPADPEHDRLVNIATDGETYGHHHRYGEMALAYALHHIEENGLARLTNYGEYLATPSAGARGGDRREHRLELRPRRRPLARGLRLPHRRRPGLDSGLAGAAAPGARLAARRARAPLGARGRRRSSPIPWAARDAYIDVLLDRSPEAVDAFLDARRGASSPEGATGCGRSSCWSCSATPC